MSNERDPELDAEIGAALQRFARNIAGDSVRVTFNGGTASIAGAVSSASAARAIEDLVRWHDGVERVESHLEVRVSVPAPASSTN